MVLGEIVQEISVRKGAPNQIVERVTIDGLSHLQEKMLPTNVNFKTRNQEICTECDLVKAGQDLAVRELFCLFHRGRGWRLDGLQRSA